jgi:dipeptidyl-peptidase 4
VVFSASEEPTEVQLWTWSALSGLSRLSPENGVHDGVAQGGTAVLTSRSLSHQGATVTVVGEDKARTLTSYAETPLLEPRVEMLILGERRLNAALVLPTWYSPGSGPLPVLLDPYGGPHHQKVLSSLSGYAVSQWFAQQGFAVLVVDGRGSPARGTTWERAIYRDFAGPVLEDQMEGLNRTAEIHPEQLDLGRVAIRGWSFGGWLAALAVLSRPDVFHAAVAGAPVTDHRLYDTHYEERYLGQPEAEPQAYERNSLLPLAAGLSRPLLVVHGLADDNVVVAHTLRLSSALLAAGRPHCVLPLSGVTHMTPQEVVAEKLLLLEREFLLRSLGMPDPAGDRQI